MTAQLPAWIADEPDHVVNLILAMAWCKGCGEIDGLLACSIAASSLTVREDPDTTIMRRLDHIAELVALAETFDDDPHTAVDVWNVANNDTVSHSEAQAMRDQLRADAAAAAHSFAHTRQPHLKAV